MKYSKAIVEKICSLMASDDYTIVEICQQVGITKETFYTWKEKKTDFSNQIKAADNQRLDTFKKLVLPEIFNSLHH